jgi:adenylyltransferase/sulfurtransferase
VSRFAIIGAGGLGGPIAYALAAAGADRITVCDFDTIELSNLQRQIQFTTNDVGASKAQTLANELARRGYARERVRVVDERFSPESAPAILRGARVAIDGSDNFPTKFAVNDACCAADIPFVIGGVSRYSGQVLAAIPGRTGCYRCVFEAPPPDDDGADSCATAGVLGATVAVVAGYSARAALALAAGDPTPAGQLLVFDDIAASAEPRPVQFRHRAGCTVCKSPSTAAVAEVEAP